MIYEKNTRHLRVRPENADVVGSNKIVEHKRYSLCRTSTGWLYCKKTSGSEMNQKMGLGLAIYFKQLKALVILFTLFTIISIPAFILYYFGGNDESLI
jgi:hypothetical protein